MTRPDGPSRPAARFARLAIKKVAAHPILALLAVTGLAAAAITITYSTDSTLTTSVTPAPVQFLAGDDAGPGSLTDYVTAYAISSNKTYITTTLKGVPESSLVVDSFFKLQNVDDASHGVTLSTPQVANAYVTTYTIGIFDASNALQDTLTLTAGTPSATVTIPAGETYTAKLTLGLATGAGADNVALSNALSLAVS